MKKILVGVGLAIVASVSAVETNVLSAAERAKKRMQMREKMLRVTGGRIRQPDSGKGFFAFINAQSRVPAKAFQELAKVIDATERIDVRVLAGNDNPEDRASALKATGASLGVFLVDNTKYKSRLLLAPEDGWAIVNVAALAIDNPAAVVLEKRTRIETMRAFALLMGGVGSQYQGNMLDPIRSPRDLEMYLEELPIDVTGKFVKYAGRFGIRPYRETFYRTAVEEGWAPQPTNDYQRAVWKRVHELPKAPLKLEK